MCESKGMKRRIRDGGGRNSEAGAMLKIFIVSDATGKTAETLVRAALVQFENCETELVIHGEIRTRKRVASLVAEAVRENAFIVHTLVSDELRGYMVHLARLNNLDTLDLMGSLLDKLAGRLQIAPNEKPGLFQQRVEAKSRQIEAIEFAFRHDDGMHMEEIGGAEVVITGISRSMKTPVTLFLAYRGWFAMNVPIILGAAPSPEFLAVNPKRVFCLFIEPERLRRLRLSRALVGRIPEEPYASIAQIREELVFARHLCSDHQWQEVDATSGSVEEVTQEILSVLKVLGLSKGRGA
jgi:[pyruvate, water dikinase]-phosphate phosphotransferase / [pyruvate, water dikinase] kinase